jgi:hypothetical protein
MPGPNIGLTYDPVSFLIGYTASIGPQTTASGDYDDMAIDACVTSTGCYPLVATAIWQQIKDSAAEFLAAEAEHAKHVKEAEPDADPSDNAS